MKLVKRMILGGCLTLLCFGIGIAPYWEYQAVSAYFYTEEDQTVQVPGIESNHIPAQYEQVLNPANEPPPAPPSDNDTTYTEKNVTPANFDASGEYFSEEQTPKGFKTFSSITLEMRDYDDTSEENLAGTPIPPKGYISFKKEFKFARIAIGGGEIGFETVVIDGISYRFTGHFADMYNDNYTNTYFPSKLKGKLTKLANGKKVADVDLNLYPGGC